MTDDAMNAKTHSAQPSADFRSQVEGLLAAGKLSAEDAQGLLAGLDEPVAAALQLQPGPQTTGDIPPDLRLSVVGYQLAVVVDPALSAPQLSCSEPDQLDFAATTDGWQLKRRASPDAVQVVGATLRAILSVPFVPRDVQAGLHGGLLTLPDIAGEMRADINGGNVRMGAANSLQAEVNGGNLHAGDIAGPTQTTINGGNLTLGGATALQASVNGGNLNWTGVLQGGQHTLEVNAGNATLRLLPGSSLRVDADVTVGSFRADFETHKQGGFINTRHTGQLNGGAALLTVKVAAGQVRLVSQ